jgi:sugar-phosphatase
VSEAPTRLAAQAVLFDLDGVLVDSTASVEHHWREWATRHGLDPAAILGVVHGRRAIDTIREQAPHLDAERELAALVDSEAKQTDGIVAMAGARALIASLPTERWAIVTSGTRRVATARLQTAGLPLPGVMITADRVTQGKPDPEGYLAAARALGMEPSGCIVVEDAPAGIEAAHRAGMRCIAVATTHPPEALTGATVVASGLYAVSVAGDPGGRLVLSVAP